MPQTSPDSVGVRCSILRGFWRSDQDWQKSSAAAFCGRPDLMHASKFGRGCDCAGPCLSWIPRSKECLRKCSATVPKHAVVAFW